jgi:hypothetical protein
LLFCAAELLGGSLAAPQILPFLEYLPRSSALALRSAFAPEEQHGQATGGPLTLVWAAALLAAAVAVWFAARRVARGKIAWAGVGLLVVFAGLAFLTRAGLAQGLEDAYVLLVFPNLYGSPVLGGDGGGYGGPRNYNAVNGGYVGLLTLLLAIMTCFAPARDRRTKVWRSMMIGAAIVAYRVPPFSQALNLVPPFSISADNRIMPVATLFAGLLAGSMLDQIRSGALDVRQRARALLGTSAVVAGAALGFVWGPVPSHRGWVPERHAVPQTLSRPFGKLVEPRVEEILTGPVVRVRGFALDDQPLTDIRVRLDYEGGAVTGTATVGLPEPRPDNEALRVYPEFERAGFVAELKLPSTLENGSAVLRVTIVDSDGQRAELTPRRVTLQRDLCFAAGLWRLVPAILWFVAMLSTTRLGIVAVLLVGLDLFGFARGYNPEIERDQVKPPLPALQELSARDPAARAIVPFDIFPDNMATKYGVRDVRGDDVLGVVSYEALLRTLPASKYGSYPIDPVGWLARLIDARYTIDAPGKEPLPGFTKIANGALAIWESPNAEGRARYFSHARSHAPLEREQTSSPRALREVLSALEAPLDEVLIEGAVTTIDSGGRGTARITVDLPSRVAIDVECDRQGFLFLGDTYFPGWQATVDDEPAAIRRADIAFRAVEVPAGRHVVEFRYRPRSFWAGVWLAAAALVVIVALALWSRARARASTP